MDVSKESLMKSSKKSDDIVVNTISEETILTEEDKLPLLLTQPPEPSQLESLPPDSSPTSDITVPDSLASPTSSPSDQLEQTESTVVGEPARLEQTKKKKKKKSKKKKSSNTVDGDDDIDTFLDPGPKDENAEVLYARYKMDARIGNELRVSSR